MNLKERIKGQQNWFLASVVVLIALSMVLAVAELSGVDITNLGIILITAIVFTCMSAITSILSPDLKKLILGKSNTSKSNAVDIVDPEYFTKLQQDVIEPIKNQTEKDQDLFLSMYNLPESDRLPILAHLYTAEKFSPQFKDIYSEYKETATQYRRIFQRESRFLYELLQFPSKIRSKFILKNKHEAWFDNEKFEEAVSFPKELHVYIHDSEIVKKYVDSYIRFDNLSVDPHKEKADLVLNNVVIGGSNSLEFTQDLYDIYNKEIQELLKVKEELKESYFFYPIQKRRFEELVLIPILKDVHLGKTRMGVCRRCLEHFHGLERENWKCLLEEFYQKESEQV